MTEDRQKMKNESISIENHHKIYKKKFMTEGSRSGNRIRFFPGRGQENICMYPDPVCPERLNPDQVKIRPDPKP